MRVLWHSNAPWAGTGYGQQTSLFCRALQGEGHDVAVSAFYGLAGASLTWEGLHVYPSGVDTYGNDVLVGHARDWRADVVVTLVDVWVLNAGRLSELDVACWTPIDHDPIPPEVVRTLEASGARPWAMSRFGERLLHDAGLDCDYVPHGIDTDLFVPRDRPATREEIGLPPDAFIVGMIAANKGFPARKGFAEAIAAFAEFRKERPDAYLLLQTEPHGIYAGVHLPSILTRYGVPPECVSLSDERDHLVGYSPELMAKIVGSLDVLFNPAYGEGFAIPIIEAAACGIPSIVTDWTAMPEVGAVGWQVDGQPLWTQQGSWWKVPAVNGLLAALEDAYEKRDDAEIREAAREHALGYDYRRVLREYLLPALEGLAARSGVSSPISTAPLPASVTA